MEGLDIVKKDFTMADDRNADLSQKAHLTVGSYIKCRYQGGEVEGQVQAFHTPSRLLIISKFKIGEKNILTMR